jgi:ABC-type protease/lipase transport system fused ATPase/permease subunit
MRVCSAFHNLLLLVPSIYMLRFDRVDQPQQRTLKPRFCCALVVMFLLDQLRARLLMGAGMLLDRLLGGSVLAMLIENASRAGANEYVHGLRDAGALRGFLAGNSIIALFDAPWLPFFIAVIFVFHPLLGFVALGGASLLLLLAWANEKLTRQPLEAMQAASRRAGRYIDTSLRNAEVVNAMGMQQSVRMRWEKLNQDVIKLQSSTGRIAGLVGGSSKFLRQFIQIAMLGTGAYLVIDQHVTPGVMMAATIILGRALAPVEGLIANWKVLLKPVRHAPDAILENAPKLLEETELPSSVGPWWKRSCLRPLIDKPIIKYLAPPG